MYQNLIITAVSLAAGTITGYIVQRKRNQVAEKRRNSFFSPEEKIENSSKLLENMFQLKHGKETDLRKSPKDMSTEELRLFKEALSTKKGQIGKEKGKFKFPDTPKGEVGKLIGDVVSTAKSVETKRLANPETEGYASELVKQADEILDLLYSKFETLEERASKKERFNNRPHRKPRHKEARQESFQINEKDTKPAVETAVETSSIEEEKMQVETPAENNSLGTLGDVFDKKK